MAFRIPLPGRFATLLAALGLVVTFAARRHGEASAPSRPPARDASRKDAGRAAEKPARPTNAGSPSDFERDRLPTSLRQEFQQALVVDRVAPLSDVGDRHGRFGSHFAGLMGSRELEGVRKFLAADRRGPTVEVPAPSDPGSGERPGADGPGFPPER